MGTKGEAIGSSALNSGLAVTMQRAEPGCPEVFVKQLIVHYHKLAFFPTNRLLPIGYTPMPFSHSISDPALGP